MSEYHNIIHAADMLDNVASELSSIRNNMRDNDGCMKLLEVIQKIYTTSDMLHSMDFSQDDEELDDVINSSQFMWMLLKDIATNYDTINKKQLCEFVELYTSVDGKFNPRPDEIVNR